MNENTNPSENEMPTDSSENSKPGTWLGQIARLPAIILVGTVRLYQIFISPLLGKNCRFTPTCSAYFIQAVEKYGVMIGSLKGLWRICRCNPFCRGGHDPP